MDPSRTGSAATPKGQLHPYEQVQPVLDDANARPVPAPLSRAALRHFHTGVREPDFEVSLLRPGILHIGCGAFHRAHQAVFTQRAIEEENCAGQVPAPWGIVAASLRSPCAAELLIPQQRLYSVLERGPRQRHVEVVGSLCDVLFTGHRRQDFIDYSVDPSIHLITLTITPRGYCLDADSSGLDPAPPDIVADLLAPWPRSAIGVLVKVLELRWHRGIPPPVVLSCDNVQRNGATLRRACVEFAGLRNTRLSDWIAANVQFPSTVVDRIVPGCRGADLQDACRALGFMDAAPVGTEPFAQWVIERFDGPRPLWEAAGAEFVRDVAPWEASKLRLLNGGHLVMAYLGLLAGYHTIAETVADPVFAQVALSYMLDEQMPTLPRSDHDIRAYAHQLIERWRNPGIEHPLERIGRDGSSKLAARLLSSLRDNRKVGRPAPFTLLGIAAWICCMTDDIHLNGAISVQDPLWPDLANIRNASPKRLIDDLMQKTQIFGEDLGLDAKLHNQLARAVATLRQRGSRQAASDLLEHLP